MTERVIRVVLDPTGVRPGANEIRGALRGVQGETRQTSQSFLLLRRVIGATLTIAAIRQVSRYTDEWTLLNNRLRLVTDSQQELTTVQGEIIDLARQTRIPLTSAAELFSRVARSSEELGESQRALLDVTRTVNQAIQISGATTQEAAAGTIQFAQGLASGALRGDELRSVLEQLPRLARALADGLDVSIGELRELGSEGELTAERVIGALQGQAPEIQREFEQITPTIGSALSALGTSLRELFGRINDVTGVSRGISGVLISVANSINESVTPGFLRLAEAVGLVDDRLNLLSLSQLRSALERERQAISDLQDGIIAGFETAISSEGIDELTRAGRERIRVLQDLIREREALLDRDVGDILGAAETTANQRDLIQTLEQTRIELALQTRFLDEAEDQIFRYQVAVEAAATGNSEFVTRALAAADAVIEQRDALRTAEAAQAAYDEDVARAAQITASVRTETERYIDSVIELQMLLEQGLIDQETFNRAVEQLEDAGDSIDVVLDQAFRNIQDTLGEGIAGIITGDIEDVPGQVANILARVAGEILASELFQLFQGTQTGGGLGGRGILGIFQGILGGIFGGGFGTGQTLIGAPAPSGVPGQVFAQQGFNGVVPPGFPNDTFRLNVSSGERVQVTPAGQRGGDPLVIQQSFTLNGGADERDAALVATASEIATRRALEAVSEARQQNRRLR